MAKWRARAGVLAVTFAGCAAASSVVPAAAATSAATRYSDPIYWPIRVDSAVDCTMHNPGCPNHHDYWGVDVIPTGQRGGNPASLAGVYSMGSGIAHIG